MLRLVMIGAIAIGVIAIVGAVSSTTVQADKPDANEKADKHAANDHVKQADHTCEKAGYDGYINDDCGFLN